LSVDGAEKDLETLQGLKLLFKEFSGKRGGRVEFSRAWRKGLGGRSRHRAVYVGFEYVELEVEEIEGWA
jgi:hypothetical protein